MMKRMMKGMTKGMIKGVIEGAMILALAALTMTAGGCSGGDKTAGEAGGSDGEMIIYGQGVFNEERSPDASWRWMEPEGYIKLKNTGRDMTLKLSGNAPVASFPEAPTVRFYFNGELLEEVKATPELMHKEYVIPAARQGSGEWSELKITSDKFFIPKEVDKNSQDPRRLAFSLTGLTWEPKP